MYTLIAFATGWGTKHGGINSFNTDFLKAFGIAFQHSAQIICFADSASANEIEDANNAFVTLIELDNTYSSVANLLNELHPTLDSKKVICLGHDRITGAIAIRTAKDLGCRSTLVHHMSYDAYESFAEDSKTAYQKSQEQAELFKQADLILAIGPLLRDSAEDMVSNSQTVHMLIPGLAEEIEIRNSPKTFSAFLSGRLTPDAARIKQGHLGIAAFAHAHKLACLNGMPEQLIRQPKITLRGVDFESVTQMTPDLDPEAELKTFAEKYADRAVNLQALPYTSNRNELYNNLSKSSVALMPSWHEGFGLTAWEAIAAGIPLILSKQSGVYRLLEEKFDGNGTGCVHVVDVKGSHNDPYFKEEDLKNVAEMLKKIAYKPEAERQKATTLRQLLLSQYTWPACAEEAAKAFDWDLQKGSAPSISVILKVSQLDTVSQPSIQHNLIKIPARANHNESLTDSQLLLAEEAIVPFDSARQPELDKLGLWLDDKNYKQAIRLVTGEGGLGKTRLAIELCQQRVKLGWHAGLMDSNLSPKEIKDEWQAIVGNNQPSLIVIDYAETRQSDLINLLKSILQSDSTSQVRILLLARDGGEWWDILPAKDKICEPLLSSYATSGPYNIPPLHTEKQNRQQAYKAAMQAFANFLGCPSIDVSPDLSADHFGRPLYLQMAALLALRGERPSSAQGLTRSLLNHELRYWHGSLQESGIPEPTLYAKRLLALTTLAGGFQSSRYARESWNRSEEDTLNTAQFNMLFETLRTLYPGEHGLQALRPDLLGEALVAEVLQTPIALSMLTAVLGKNASNTLKQNALTVLARLSNNHPELSELLTEAFVNDFSYFWSDFLHVARETPSNLPLIAEASFTRLPLKTQYQLSGSIPNHIKPGTSVQLAIFDCLVRSKQVERLEVSNKKENNINKVSEFAAALGNYTLSLSYLNEFEMALKTAKQVLDIYAWLAIKNPNIYESEYAKALSNYSNHLADVSRDAEALDFAFQALQIRKKLLSKYPKKYEDELATSLSNYANCLSILGRNDEAITFSEEALEIRKRMAAREPGKFRHELSGSLKNYANRLYNLGMYNESLEISMQSMEISTQLAKENPDQFEPQFASSLSSMANRVGDIGHIDEALNFQTQALEILERLASKNPKIFQDELAGTMNNYASTLSERGRYTEALETSKKALKISEQLNMQGPDHYVSIYGIILNNLANRLNEIGESNEAVVYCKRSTELFEQLAKKNPDRFTEPYFGIYCNYCFSKWLNNESISDEQLEALKAIPDNIPSHLRDLSLLRSYFVQGCLSSNFEFRKSMFQHLVSSWIKFPHENQTNSKEFFLCAASWCERNHSAALANIQWQKSWKQFYQDRLGNLPQWMLTLSDRLKFKWQLID